MAKISKKQKTLLNHEILDRAYISYEGFNTFIVDHPALKGELKKEAKELNEQLFNFYQKVGTLSK